MDNSKVSESGVPCSSRSEWVNIFLAILLATSHHGNSCHSPAGVSKRMTSGLKMVNHGTSLVKLELVSFFPFLSLLFTLSRSGYIVFTMASETNML